MQIFYFHSKWTIIKIINFSRSEDEKKKKKCKYQSVDAVKRSCWFSHCPSQCRKYTFHINGNRTEVVIRRLLSSCTTSSLKCEMGMALRVADWPEPKMTWTVSDLGSIWKNRLLCCSDAADATNACARSIELMNRLKCTSFPVFKYIFHFFASSSSR